MCARSSETLGLSLIFALTQASENIGSSWARQINIINVNTEINTRSVCSFVYNIHIRRKYVIKTNSKQNRACIYIYIYIWVTCGESTALCDPSAFVVVVCRVYSTVCRHPLFGAVSGGRNYTSRCYRSRMSVSKKVCLCECVIFL